MTAHGILAVPPPPHDSRVLHLKTPQFPNFRFEWHPGTKTVYLIRLGSSPLIGEPIAFEVQDHGSAWNMVQVFLRGYRAATTPKMGDEK